MTESLAGLDTSIFSPSKWAVGSVRGLHWKRIHTLKGCANRQGIKIRKKFGRTPDVTAISGISALTTWQPFISANDSFPRTYSEFTKQGSSAQSSSRRFVRPRIISRRLALYDNCTIQLAVLVVSSAWSGRVLGEHTKEKSTVHSRKVVRVGKKE